MIKAKKYPQTAVILAAGIGSRMHPLTSAIPKPMAPIKNTTIIANALETLNRFGVNKVIVVCGHHADVLQEYCLSLGWRGSIEFKLNPFFSKTNSMYSLAIGLDGLNEDSWVLEGDVFFEDDMFCDFHPSSTITWLGDSSYNSSGGSFLTPDSRGILKEVKILESSSEIKTGMYKSTGIFFINKAVLEIVRDWLRFAICQEKQNLYYDLIFAEHVKDLPIHVHGIKSAKWAEIDTIAELQEAEKFLI